MNKEIIIDNLLAGSKDNNLFLLDNFVIDDLGEIICSYLNSGGGDIIIGINRNKIPTGISNEWESIIFKSVLTKLKPDAPITINTIPYHNEDVILVSIWPGANKPYSYKHKIYILNKGIPNLASPRILKSLSKNRKNSDFHWERKTVLGASIDELDQQEIKKTIESYLKRNPGANKLSINDFLIKTGLMVGGNLTNAAIVLFAENPLKYLPQTKIRTTVYNSSKSGNVILFDRIYNNSLFKNINSIWDFYETYLKRSETIKGLIRRKEKLPIFALREGLLNALIHRDYSQISSTLTLEVYPDKLVISNTGELPEGMSFNDLSKDHNSVLINPDIAYICYLRGLIEMLGTGTLRMIDDCKSNAFPKPIWKHNNGKVVLTLDDISHRINNDGATDGISDGISDGVNAILHDGVNDGVSDGVSDGVKEAIISIIRLLIKEEGINTTTIVKELASKSKPTVERYLKSARELSMIEYKGSAKTGGYYLTKHMKKHIE